MTYFSPDKPNSHGMIAPPYKAEDWPISRTRDLNLMAAVLDSKGIVAHEVARITPWLTWLRREPRAKLSDGQRTYVSQIARQMGRLEFPEEFLAKPEARAAERTVSGAAFKSWLLQRKRWKTLAKRIRADAGFPSREVTGPQLTAYGLQAFGENLLEDLLEALGVYLQVRGGHPCSGVTSSSRPPVQPQPEHQAPRST